MMDMITLAIAVGCLLVSFILGAHFSSQVTAVEKDAEGKVVSLVHKGKKFVHLP